MPWSNFEKNNKDFFTKYQVAIKEFTEESVGDNDFHAPKFSLGSELTDEEVQQLIDLDLQLQDYLRKYDERAGHDVPDEEDEE